MTNDDYIMIAVCIAIAAFFIWVLSPYGRRTIAAAHAQEKVQEKAEIELAQLRQEQEHQFERMRLELEAEKERMRLELEAERAKLEAELGVSLQKEPEVVYIEKEVPVMVGQDQSQAQPQPQPQQTSNPASNLGKGVAKTLVKSAAAFGGGYLVGKKWF